MSENILTATWRQQVPVLSILRRLVYLATVFLVADTALALRTRAVEMLPTDYDEDD